MVKKIEIMNSKSHTVHTLNYTYKLQHVEKKRKKKKKKIIAKIKSQQPHTSN